VFGQGGPGSVRGGGRDAGRGRWARGLLGCRTARAQLGEDLLAAAAAQREQYERIGVDGGGDGVAERGGVFAGVSPVGAGAFGVEFGGLREEGDAGVAGVVHEFGGRLAVEECREMPGPGRDGVEEGVPLGVGEDGQVDGGAVGAGPAALYGGFDLAGGDGDGADHALAGVGASAGQAPAVQAGVLQGRHPRLAPPGRGEGALPTGGRAARAGQ
jgi:hypothetical protein